MSSNNGMRGNVMYPDLDRHQNRDQIRIRNGINKMPIHNTALYAPLHGLQKKSFEDFEYL
jgi:hypothetical protein